MRSWMAAGLVPVAMVGWLASAYAQEPIQQTVVVTAAAGPVTLGSATRTVTVITREQIDALPAWSVADLLRLVSSVDVRSRGERGVQSDFSVRGAGFGQMLVLVDGVRLNDVQSGHHNGDIPVPLDAIERIEVLHGPGSSLFGADAFGGTINVITRRAAVPAAATIEGGSFGYVGARGQAGFTRGSLRQTLSVATDRSDGFMFARDFARLNARSDTSFGRTHVSASFLTNDFGANGFYGASPSHEWTNQTLLSADRRLGTVGGWQLDGVLSYRTHGDRFLWDVRVPGVSDNRHRTHAVLGTMKASRRIGAGTSLVAGLEGGADWIRSNNLGDHETQRVSVFGEWRQALGRRTEIEASLRADRYSEFGTSWSPGVGAGWWATSVLRVRASAGRAFRVPTFTERYYSDPAHLARPDLGPETAWSGDLGGDLFLSNGWLVSATFFGRDEQDVIDWLRPTTADRWRTYNVRSVTTIGVEVSARKMIGAGAFVQAGYTGLRLRSSQVTQLSKYVQDVTPHALVAAASVPLPGRLFVAPRFEYKHRRYGAADRDATLLDLRLSRRIGRIDLRLEATNLFDDRYQDIAGIDMPGRAVMGAIAIGSR